MRGELVLRGPQLAVEPAQRRAAIAGDKAGRAVAGGPIPRLLHHRQTHQRLDAGDEYPPDLDVVLVVQRDVFERYSHRPSRFPQPQLQKSPPSRSMARDSTILCTSDAPSTRRACRA